jgi:TPR repeat protein
MKYPKPPFATMLPRQAVLALALCLALLNNAFADRDQALAAQASGDYTSAAKLWLQLANDGDPLAQYNLALLYQRGAGVATDNNLFKYWLAMAARQGMAEAYVAINAKSLQPTGTAAARVTASSAVPASATATRAAATTVATASVTTTTGDANMGPQEWVAAQDPDYYTLQLASSTNRALIDKYYSENDLAGKAGYYRSRRSGEDWYALVYGAYPTVQDAKDAIESLPVDLKKWSPWVRNIKSIHKIMVR